MISLCALITSTTLVFASDFTITVDSLGIGNRWSNRTATPLQISVKSSSSTPTAAWIQWEVPDANGDLVLWGKQMTLSPNSSTSIWLYAPLQPWAHDDIEWKVSLRGWNGTTPTETLSSTSFSSNSIRAMHIKPEQGIIAIFGTKQLGLTTYQSQKMEVKQEAIQLISGLQNNDLPDSWVALESLDSIVWADAAPALSLRQEDALFEWIKRGGNLVVSLPAVGNPWNIGSPDAPLADLFKGVEISFEQMPLGFLDQVVGRNNGWPTMKVPIYTFKFDHTFYPTVQLKNKKTIGVQKNVGHGSFTLLGIDVSSGLLASVELPEADLFWNNIFGKRSDAPSQQTISTLKLDEQLSSAIPTNTIVELGTLISQEIAMSTTASGRLGIVFIIIILYWLIAGPIGFYLLFKMRKQRWSWMVFTAVGSLFTLLTLALSRTTSSIKTPIRHISIIDHVYGAQGQLAKGWFSLYMPKFGSSQVQLDGGSNNLLLPWSTPNSSLTPLFIDQKEVVVNLDYIPNSFDQPSRATTANFSYNWLGGINLPFYSSLIRVVPNKEPKENSEASLTGEVINNASSALYDVTILWITDFRMPFKNLGRFQNGTLAPWVDYTKSGQPLRQAYMWRLPQWNAEEIIRFSQLDTSMANDFTKALEGRYIPKIPANQFIPESTFLSKKDWRKKLEEISLYSHLITPTYQKMAGEEKSPPSFRTIRKGGRSFDFAEWFSKPCIIVMGFLQNAPIPVSISVDGENVAPSTGETFVRWIYPLGELQ